MVFLNTYNCVSIFANPVTYDNDQSSDIVRTILAFVLPYQIWSLVIQFIIHYQWESLHLQYKNKCVDILPYTTLYTQWILFNHTYIGSGSFLQVGGGATLK